MGRPGRVDAAETGETAREHTSATICMPGSAHSRRRSPGSGVLLVVVWCQAMMRSQVRVAG